MSEEQPINPSQPVRATITERKLSIVAHNTWSQLGHPSIISLSKDLNGEIQTTGTIKVLDYVLHPSISLIFKLSYRGKSYFMSIHYSGDQRKVWHRETVRFHHRMVHLLTLLDIKEQ
jgi:hypothetical protein